VFLGGEGGMVAKFWKSDFEKGSVMFFFNLETFVNTTKHSVKQKGGSPL